MTKYIGSKYRYLLSFLVIFVSLSWLSKLLLFPDINVLFGPITPAGLGFLIAWCLPILVFPNEEVRVDSMECKIFSDNIRGSTRCINLKKIDIEKSQKRSFFNKLNFNYTIFGNGKKEKIVISSLTFGAKLAKSIHQEVLELARNA